jgi:hypothetical protein
LYTGNLSPRPKIGRQRARTSVVAYADDVTKFVTAATDIRKLQEAINCYEAASGARVNIKISRAIAFGKWDKSIDIMNIPYHNTAKILGFQIKDTVQESALASWTKATANIRAQAQDAYCRMLTMDKKYNMSTNTSWRVHGMWLKSIPRLMCVCVN